jgi:hypothetical protein
MTLPKGKIVAGVFDHSPQAEQAVLELRQAGFAHDRIDMIARGEVRMEGTPRMEWQTDAANGAIVGAATGATVGAMAGALATLLIPGVGVVLGGGLLTILGASALGAAGGTFVGPFLALEMAPDEAEYYAKEVDEGRTVVLVQTKDRAAEAWNILERHGARRASSAKAAVGAL